jgi:hypothetical protein
MSGTGAASGGGDWGCLLDPTRPPQATAMAAAPPAGGAVVSRKPRIGDPAWTRGATWVIERGGLGVVACVSKGFGKHDNGFVVWPAQPKPPLRWRPLVDRMSERGAVSFARDYARNLEA